MRSSLKYLTASSIILLVEVPHGLVYHLGGLVRRHPVEPAEAFLEVAEVALDDGVVVAAAPAGHAPHHPVLAGEAQVLPAPVQPAAEWIRRHHLAAYLDVLTPTP